MVKRSGRRRTLLKWLGGAVGIVLLVAVAALLLVDHLGRLAIEAAGTRALGVATTLDQLSLGIFSGKSSLSDFQVANPQDFESSYFLRLDSGSLDMSLGNLLSETTEIEQLSLSGIHLNLVREAKQTNFLTIIANTRRFEEELARQSETDLRSGKRFLIHSVVIRDVHVNVDLLPIGGKLTELDVPIEIIELKDVGAENSRGENMARVIATIVRALLEAVVAKGESILPPETMQELSAMLSELKPLETLRSLRNSLQERREQRKQHEEPARRPFGIRRQRRLEQR